MTAPILDVAVLNRTHRDRQAANAVAVQRLVNQLFLQMIDPTNIAGTAQQWLVQAMQAILRGRQSSYLLASAYATAIRRIQVPDAPAFTIPKPPDPPAAQLLRSLTYTGPGKLAVDLAKIPEPIEPPDSAPHFEHVEYDKALAEHDRRVKEAPKKAAVMSSAAAFRHVTNGGRDTIDYVVTNDPVAVGYLRVTKEQPCAFCLMLASRGPVYKKDSFEKSDPRFTGPGEHKVHDACGCGLQPLYGGTSPKHWTDQAREAEQLWINGKDEKGRSPASYSGNDAINAFARIARKAGMADLNRW